MAAQDATTPQVSYPTVLPYPPAQEPHFGVPPSSGMATQDTLALHSQVSYPTILAPGPPTKEPHYKVPLVMNDVVDLADFQKKQSVKKCFESSNFAYLFHPSEETLYCDECEDEYEEPVELVKHYFNTHDVRFDLCTHCGIEIPWNEALINNHIASCLTCPGPPKCTSCSLLARK